ncbi:MAG: CopG family transcriptional regulator [Phycisphaerae bacterium SM23_30]|nr:MAG: CopG family transcriptional regulator [Phycisphaerae bacterium SM23_30]
MINDSKKSDKVTIKIPRPLYKKISQVIEGSGYNSVTDFTVYVLRDLVASHDLAGKPEKEQEDLERVKQRLRALGYL